MKNSNFPKNNARTHGSTTSDRAHYDVKLDKKKVGITNAGGQRSDQTSNRDNERKRGQ